MTLPLDRVLLQASPVLPVLVIEDVALAPDLARALYAGGVTVLEVTLRTPQALDAIAAIHREVPEVLLGAGTLIHTEQFLGHATRARSSPSAPDARRALPPPRRMPACHTCPG